MTTMRRRSLRTTFAFQAVVITTAMLTACGSDTPAEPVSSQARSDQRVMQWALEGLVAECMEHGQAKAYARWAAPPANIALKRAQERLPNGLSVIEMGNRMISAVRATGVCSSEVEALDLAFNGAFPSGSE